MQRLGKNINGYLGERLDLSAVERDCIAAAKAHGWTIDEIHPQPRRILGLTRHAPPVLRSSTAEGGRTTQQPRRIYLSTGIHGDEPAGPLAARQLLQDNAWPPGLDIWLCPWLKPTGFELV